MEVSEWDKVLHQGERVVRLGGGGILLEGRIRVRWTNEMRMMGGME